MASVFDLRDVFELVIDAFQAGPFAQEGTCPAPPAAGSSYWSAAWSPLAGHSLRSIAIVLCSSIQCTCLLDFPPLNRGKFTWKLTASYKAVPL